jgi:drug/metabolite transporter (DMT)-like permease
MGILSLLVLVTLLSRHGASRVSAPLLLVPVVTAIASVPALGESLHRVSLAGMAVAMAGVGTVLGRHRDTVRPPRQATLALSDC